MKETDQLLIQTQRRMEEIPRHTPPPWPERFLAALPPWSDRAMVGVVLFATFVAGFATAMMFVATRDLNRGVTEVQRLIAQMPSRPPLQQQLDALEQRVQALEYRQTP
jgi:HAMP domain-containing protein